MVHLDRRAFVGLAAGTTVAALLPWPATDLSPAMSANFATMRDAMAALEVATHRQRTFWCAYVEAGLIAQDGFWDWYQGQPVSVAYRNALDHARFAVEAAFATSPGTPADEDAVMKALDAYEEIYPYAFAMQTARDLFTPRRYQTYPLDRMRHWLLTDPDEDFAKSGMPPFLRTLRDTRLTV